MATVNVVIVSITAAGDGKDDNTALFGWTNLADGTQFSGGDFSPGEIANGGFRTVNMTINATPTREQVQAGFQLRFKWNPHGHDQFRGHANVEIVYSDN